MNGINALFLKLSAGHLTMASGILGALLSLLFGTWIPLMTALLVAQLCDVITGLLVGGKGGNITSTSFFDGIKKKVGMWMLIILANILDVTFLGGVPVLKSAVCGTLIAGEGLSLVENVGLLGVRVPSQLTKYLEKLQGKEKGKSNEED